MANRARSMGKETNNIEKTCVPNSAGRNLCPLTAAPVRDSISALDLSVLGLDRRLAPFGNQSLTGSYCSVF